MKSFAVLTATTASALNIQANYPINCASIELQDIPCAPNTAKHDIDYVPDMYFAGKRGCGCDRGGRGRGRGRGGLGQMIQGDLRTTLTGANSENYFEHEDY